MYRNGQLVALTQLLSALEIHPVAGSFLGALDGEVYHKT